LREISQKGLSAYVKANRYFIKESKFNKYKEASVGLVKRTATVRTDRVSALLADIYGSSKLLLLFEEH
jgi:hypothetical protein